MNESEKFMKKYKALLSLSTLIMIVNLLVGCQSEVKQDYWTKTQSIIEDIVGSGQTYEEGPWNFFISLENASKDKDRRDIKISKTLIDKKELTETTSLYFNHQGNAEHVIYVYEKIIETPAKQTNGPTGSIAYNIMLTSQGKEFKNYTIDYREITYTNGNYVDEKSAKGNITIDQKNQILYDAVPMLTEAMIALDGMIHDFEQEYKIDLEKNGFVNVPKRCKALSDFNDDINSDQDEESFDFRDYYSNIAYTATGHPYTYNLRVNKEENTGKFRKYDIDNSRYIEQYDVKLMENKESGYYDMVMIMGDQLIQKVVFLDEIAYVYPATYTDEQMKVDIETNEGKNASVILDHKELPSEL